MQRSFNVSSKPFVVLDFETASITDLKKAGARVYAQCPTTEILVLSYAVGGKGPIYRWVPGGPHAHIEQLIASGYIFCAHNVTFEKAIWHEIMVAVFGFLPIPDDQWHDTLSVCAMKAIPQALDRAARVLSLHSAKDMVSSAATTALSRPKRDGNFDRSPETLEMVGRYCDQDVRVQSELHGVLGWLPAIERVQWLQYETINRRGIRVDRDFVSQAVKVVEGATKPLLAEFKALTGLVPTQAVKVLQWVRDHGFMIPDMKKETLIAALGDPEDEDEDQILDFGRVPEVVRRPLRIRQLIGSAAVKKLYRMQHCVCADGRARDLLQWHGTAPGRSAGRLLQPQNFPRGTIEFDGKAPDIDLIVGAIMTGDHEYVSSVIGPPVETVASALRHSLISDDGKLFISGDYAGIQARVVLALAGQYDKVALMASGQDVYCDMASQIYRRLITKADKEERQTGKNSVLGLGFGMGWKKFRDKYCSSQPEEFAQRVVEVYRKQWAPEVPKLWYTLKDCATRCVWDRVPVDTGYGLEYRIEDGWLTARVPSGHKIYYRDPQRIRERMPWDEDDIRAGFTFGAQKMGQWIRVKAFGGLLTENYVMRVEVDIKNAGITACEANGFPIVLDVHDELVAECEDPDPVAFEQCLADAPQWAKDLRIPIAIDKPWIGDRYRK